MKTRASTFLLVFIVSFVAGAATAAESVVVVANDRHPPAAQNQAEILRGTCQGKTVEVRLSKRYISGRQSQSRATAAYDNRVVADLKGTSFAHDWTAPNFLARKYVFCNGPNFIIVTAFGVLVAKDGSTSAVRSQATLRNGAVEAYLPPTRDEPGYIASFLHDDEAEGGQ